VRHKTATLLTVSRLIQKNAESITDRHHSNLYTFSKYCLHENMFMIINFSLKYVVVVLTALCLCPDTVLATDVLGIGIGSDNGNPEQDSSFELRSAERKFDQAKLAVRAEDYKRAERLLNEALSDADAAGLRGRSAQIRNNADSLEREIRMLQREVKRKQEKQAANTAKEKPKAE
jgi:hypothetical protein